MAITREAILSHDLEMLDIAQTKYLGLEAKMGNIERKYGYVPRQVMKELAEAETNYLFRLAIYKDDRNDRYL